MHLDALQITHPLPACLPAGGGTRSSDGPDAAAARSSLHRLLSASLLLPPEYAGGLSSHLPMALHALHGLGATADRLQRFHAVYAARFDGLAPAAAAAAAALPDWPALRGQPAAFAPLQAGFAAALAQQGSDSVLRGALPLLLPGIAAAAFHGAIRTAHAVQAGHQGELAAALAYWACRWQAPSAAPAAAPMDLARWTAAVTAAASMCSFSGGMIAARMQQAAATDPYRQLAAALPATPAVLPALLHWAARRYADSANFTALHIVTGLHAAQVLLPWVDDAASAMPALLQAVTAAALTVGSVAAAEQRRESDPAAGSNWPAVTAAALASDDDHVIKLVHTCRAAATADPAGACTFLAAATTATSPATAAR